MSGSSHADVKLSRCVVSLDAGISISWAPDPDGSYEHGRLHHEREEASFRARIEHARPAIEVLFDELEQAGRQFLSPDAAGFQDQHRAGHAGLVEQVSVALACTPPLQDAELDALTGRVAKLLEDARGAVREPLAEPAAEEPPLAAPAPVKPWWKFW